MLSWSYQKKDKKWKIICFFQKKKEKNDEPLKKMESNEK